MRQTVARRLHKIAFSTDHFETYRGKQVRIPHKTIYKRLKRLWNRGDDCHTPRSPQ